MSLRVLAAAALALLLAAALALAAPQPAAAIENSYSWRYILSTTADLATHPPDKPLVLFLGGSAAREATVDDESWAAQILRRGGNDARIHNFGSIHQTFAMDRWLVGEFPSKPILVLIGINLGRFTASPGQTYTTEAPPFAGTYKQHHYVNVPPLPVEEKRRLVREWMDIRYAKFKDRYAYNLRQLDALIQRCLRRGYHPVLVDMPRNLPIIGHAFDLPVGRYHRDMRRLAGKYDIKWLHFVHLVGFQNRDFFDLMHLVESGRVKYQRAFSDRIIPLLKKYGLTSATTGAAAPTSGSTGPPVSTATVAESRTDTAKVAKAPP